jgi:proline-specific peptidase
MAVTRPLRLLALAAAVTLAVASCAPAPAKLSPRTGYVNVPGGRVWYQVVGSGPGVPLLLLHGGPGVPSYYLKPLAALGDDRPVIFYDQLGCGRSDHPTDSTLWTTSRFVQELAAVRQQLGLEEVDLLGHSWGTMLAADYLLTKPVGVRAVVMSSPVFSVPLYVHGVDSLRRLLPDSTQRRIERHERDGSYDSPEYQGAMAEFYGLYVARRQPLSADAESSFAGIAMPVYGYMEGPSEFTITGTLKNYDVTTRLHKLNVPTLVTAGQFDEVLASTAEYFQSLIPGAEFAAIQNSGHLTMHDNPEQYLQVVRDFLKRHDAEPH